MLEFVDSGLYFVQDENNKTINPLLQLGSGSSEKSTGCGSGGPKINGSDREWEWESASMLAAASGSSSLAETTNYIAETYDL